MKIALLLSSPLLLLPLRQEDAPAPTAHATRSTGETCCHAAPNAQPAGAVAQHGAAGCDARPEAAPRPHGELARDLANLQRELGRPAPAAPGTPVAAAAPAASAGPLATPALFTPARPAAALQEGDAELDDLARRIAELERLLEGQRGAAPREESRARVESRARSESSTREESRARDEAREEAREVMREARDEARRARDEAREVERAIARQLEQVTDAKERDGKRVRVELHGDEIEELVEELRHLEALETSELEGLEGLDSLEGLEGLEEALEGLENLGDALEGLEGLEGLEERLAKALGQEELDLDLDFDFDFDFDASDDGDDEPFELHFGGDEGGVSIHRRHGAGGSFLVRKGDGEQVLEWTPRDGEKRVFELNGLGAGVYVLGEDGNLVRHRVHRGDDEDEGHPHGVMVLDPKGHSLGSGGNRVLVVDDDGDVHRIVVPDVQVPKIKIPKVKVPKIKLPKIEVDEIHVPHVEVPHVRIPEIHVPHVEIPHADVPHVRVPGHSVRVHRSEDHAPEAHPEHGGEPWAPRPDGARGHGRDELGELTEILREMRAELQELRSTVRDLRREVDSARRGNERLR